MLELNDPALFIGKAEAGERKGEWLWTYDWPDGMEIVFVNLEEGTCTCYTPMCPHLRMVRQKVEADRG